MDERVQLGTNHQMDWTAIIIGIGAGVMTGALAAFVTPWAQWAVDVRRDRRKQRTEFIQYWRELLNERSINLALKDPKFPSLLRRFSKKANLEFHDLYHEYEENLKTAKPSIKKTNENPTGIYVDIRAEKHLESLGEPLRNFILNQLVDLEEKWKLL